MLPFSSPGHLLTWELRCSRWTPPQPRGESILHQGALSKNVDPRPQTLWLAWTSALSPGSWEVIGLGPLKISSAPVTSFCVYVFRTSHFSLHRDSALPCLLSLLFLTEPPLNLAGSLSNRWLLRCVVSSVSWLGARLSEACSWHPCGHQGNTRGEINIP